MGGYGSGRTAWHPKAEQFRNLDVNKLAKAKLLTPGYSGGWKWTVDGEKVASISMRAEDQRLILNYRICYDGCDWQNVEQPILLTQSECAYGGQRRWFLCPGTRNGRWCAKRVAKLYLGARYFLCRHCLKLTYASRSDLPMQRHMRRADKLRVALGGEPGTASLPPRKPKGMHWTTYHRMMDGIDAADCAGDVAFAQWMQGRYPGAPLEWLTD